MGEKCCSSVTEVKLLEGVFLSQTKTREKISPEFFGRLNDHNPKQTFKFNSREVSYSIYFEPETGRVEVEGVIAKIGRHDRLRPSHLQWHLSWRLITFELGSL